MILTHHIVGVATAMLIFSVGAKVIADTEPCFIVERSELLTPEVQVGGKLIGRVIGTRTKECSVEINSVLIDGSNALLPYEPFRLPSEGKPVAKEEYFFVERIPGGATPGPAEYRRYGEHRHSALNDWFHLPPVVYADYHFTITRSPESERVAEILELLAPRDKQ